MGWELKMSEQDVDISEMKVDSVSKIPLGSYVEDLMTISEKRIGQNNSVI